MSSLNCPDGSIAVPAVEPRRIVYTTIGCRLSRISPWAGTLICTCASGVMPVLTVVNGLPSVILSYLGITA